MTAETLKPFITPTSAGDGFPARPTSADTAQRRTRQLLPFVLLGIGMALVACILGLTIWQTTRVTHLNRELKSLKRVVDNLQQRLGINYLEEFDEFQKEYENAFFDLPKNKEDLTDEGLDEDGEDLDDPIEEEDEDGEATVDDDDDDDADDDINYPFIDDTEYEDYSDMLNKLNKMTTDEADTTTPTSDPTEASDGNDSSSASNDDNVFDDFTSYNDRKKKQERKSRSIADVPNEQQTVQRNHTHVDEKTSDDVAAKESSTLHHRRRKHPRTGRHLILARKGESLISARSNDFFAAAAASSSSASSKPAAHFHLSSRKPHHWPPSYHGDMYIGHAPEASKSSWQGHFRVDDGVLKVLEPGLYYVYAQICYHNSHDQNGFIVFQGDRAFLQCLNTVPTNMSQKVHTCHTSGLIRIEKEEMIHLKDIHTDRNAVLRDSNNRSYFGIFKV